MSRIRRPNAAYLLPYRVHHSQDNEDIEMGLIRAAGDDYEDPPTADGNLAELCHLQTIPLEPAAYLLPRRVHHSQEDEDIDMGLIRAGRYENEDPPTVEGNLNELCRLQAIPLELRLKIYAFVLVSGNQVLWQGKYKTAKPRTRARAPRYTCNKTHGADDLGGEKPDNNIFSLLLTCKAIHSKAAATFYRRNEFVFKCRTTSNHHSPTSFIIPPSHNLSRGLPHAFENEVFRANVHYIIFACINSKEYGRYHNCGLEKASDNIIEVAGRCAALQGLSTQESETNHEAKAVICLVVYGLGLALFVLTVFLTLVVVDARSRST